MQKIILFLLLSLACFQFGHAQQAKPAPAAPKTDVPKMAITFEQFIDWMKTLSPMGYPFTDTGKNGDEYLCTFLKDLKMIGITLSPLPSFDDYKRFKGVTPYELKGHRAVLFGQQNFWNLSVELLNLNCVIQVTSVYIDLKQADLEKIVLESGALDKKP